MIIDLDRNATTPIHPEVAQVMAECLLQGFGNAASSHRGTATVHGRCWKTPAKGLAAC